MSTRITALIGVVVSFAFCLVACSGDIVSTTSSDIPIVETEVYYGKFYDEASSLHYSGLGDVSSPIETEFTENGEHNLFEIRITEEFKGVGLDIRLIMLEDESGIIVADETGDDMHVLVEDLAIARPYQIHTLISANGYEDIYIHFFTLHDMGRPELSAYLFFAQRFKEVDPPEKIDAVLEQEPNDTLETAQNIHTSEDVYGTFSSVDDVDYYRFTIEKTGYAYIFLHGISPGNDYDMYVYGEDGETLHHSKTTSSNACEFLPFIGPLGDTFIVKVVCVSGTNPDLSYGLRLRHQQY